MRQSQITLLIALATAIGISAQSAAKWEAVVSVKGERIELDKARIVRQSDSKTSAWSRLALDRDLIDEYGLRYTAIEALNRYDCEKHSFTTVRRVYRRDGQLVREEGVANARAMAAEPGTADALLLAEVCKPRTVGEGQKIAEMASRQAVEVPEGKPTVMYADMRSADAATPAKPRQVADKPVESKPTETKTADKVAEKPGDKAADKPAENKNGERPRYIDLPKIDKSQFEDPAKDAAAKPASASAAKHGDAKPAAKPVAARAERPADYSAASRNEIERQYASSGPRKVVRKKSAETAVEEHREIHWSYEGEGSPANWSKLRSDYATCALGHRQSPIDIRDGIKVDLEPILFDYKLSHFSIVDNGHTIQVSVGEGSSIRILERQFQLVQFHFHRPSEERIGGRAFDMVVHLVHKDDEGKLAVVAIMLEKGAEHPLIQALWNNLPLEQNQEIAPSWTIDPSQLLPPPDKRAYYTYMGSLTTPPCSEDVLWMVFKQPVPVSSQQVGIFSRLYSNNARPVQPANGRLIKENR